jgi:hypothetical protein
MTTKPFVFVLMPFDQQFDDIYKLGIKATCEDLNTYCERVDEQFFEENILERIYNQIRKADIIVADLTSKNPNVFYETGYAHALGKKVILLTQNPEDIPFDLKHYSHIIYEGKIIKLKEELKKRVNWLIKHPNINVLPNELNIELFINGVALQTGTKIKIDEKYGFFYGAVYHSKEALKLKIDIHNNGTEVFESMLKIGIITQYDFSSNSDKDEKRIIRLSEREYLHMSHEFSRIYPSAWDAYEVILLSDTKQELWEKELLFTVRLFTEFGIKDFPITLIYHQLPWRSSFS